MATIYSEKKIDDKALTKTESYYSKFQCYKLSKIITYTRPSIDFIYEDTTEIVNINARNIQPFIKAFRDCIDLKQNPGIICQILSDRYYPQALSDRRNIKVNGNDYYFYDWKWHEYKTKMTGKEYFVQ